MNQVPARLLRLAALAAAALAGHAAHAGSVPMSRSAVAAASVSRCLALEEDQGHSGRVARFGLSLDPSCSGSAASAGTPNPTAQTAASPAQPPASWTPASRAAAPESAQALAAAPAASPAAAPQAPALRSAQGPAAAAEAPAPEATVLSPEQPQGSTGSTFGFTSPASELTGIMPPPRTTEVRLQPPRPPGTVPEPSSLWLLALGLAAAWRSRRTLASR